MPAAAPGLARELGLEARHDPQERRLPAPLAPRTPILAPGRNESEMSFNTSRPGPKDFESPEVT